MSHHRRQRSVRCDAQPTPRRWRERIQGTGSQRDRMRRSDATRHGRRRRASEITRHETRWPSLSQGFDRYCGRGRAPCVSAIAPTGTATSHRQAGRSHRQSKRVRTDRQNDRTDYRSELAPTSVRTDRTDRRQEARTDKRRQSYVVAFPLLSSSVRMIASAISFLVLRRCRLCRWMVR